MPIQKNGKTTENTRLEELPSSAVCKLDAGLPEYGQY